MCICTETLTTKLDAIMSKSCLICEQFEGQRNRISDVLQESLMKLYSSMTVFWTYALNSLRLVTIE